MSSDGSTTTLELMCYSGYESTGWTSVECGTDGNWQYSQLSTCGKYRNVLASAIYIVCMDANSLTYISITFHFFFFKFGDNAITELTYMYVLHIVIYILSFTYSLNN